MKNGVKLIIIGLGCSLGALVRYYCIDTIGKAFQDPTAIITVNILGCFIMGIFTALGLKKKIGTNVLPFLTTGFCGGLTTFSEFAESTYLIGFTTHPILVIIYILATMIIGLAALYFGMYVIYGKKIKEVYK